MLSLTLLAASFLIYAEAAAQTVSSEEAAQAILQRHGFPAVTANLTAGQKIELAQMVLSDPDAIQVSGGISHFDELADVEAFVNLDDQELRSRGLTQEEININRIKIADMLSATDAQWMRDSGRSAEEMKLLRMAMEPSDTYENKVLEGNQVTSSGYISESTLQFYLITVNNKQSPTPNIAVITTFEWMKSPIIALTDEVVIAWGGGLHSKDWFMDIFFAPNFAKQKGLPSGQLWPMGGVPVYTEKVPDSGLKFLIDIDITHCFISGAGGLLLYKNINKIGDDVELVAQYAHETITPDGGISIGAAPSISINWGGFGFRYTPQEQITVHNGI